MRRRSSPTFGLRRAPNRSTLAHANEHRDRELFGFLDGLRAVIGINFDPVVSGAVKNRIIAADIEHTLQAFPAE